MQVYHMSDTLQLGMTLSQDYKGYMALTEPFVQALERSEDCFYGMLFSAKYLRAALGKFGLRDMATNYTKWATEGIFEFVRRTEFPDCYCRLMSNYYFAQLDECKELYELDWGGAPEEERSKIRLFVVELEDETPQIRDMRLFDEGFDAMWDHEDVQTAFDCARRYFAGAHSAHPIWEIMSDKVAVAVMDITEQIRP